MEKNNLFVPILIGVVFVAIVGYILYSKAKRKSASWVGTVIDKNVMETATRPANNMNNQQGITFGRTNAINRSYNLKIRDDAGKEFNWPVGEGVYETVQVGDRLNKSPGTEVPVKL